MGTKHTSADYSPDALEHLADRITSHADRYRVIAKQVRELAVESLVIPYPSHIADALEGLRKHVFQAELAIAKLLDLPPEHREITTRQTHPTGAQVDSELADMAAEVGGQSRVSQPKTNSKAPRKKAE